MLLLAVYRALSKVCDADLMKIVVCSLSTCECMCAS